MSIFLETKRLIVKTPELSDLDNLITLRSDPDVMKYTGDDVQDKEEVKEALVFFISYYNKHGMGFFSVFEKETNSFVGQAGLFHLLFDDTQSEIEIAYRLHKKFWGKGYATELAKAIIQWGFQHLSKGVYSNGTKLRNNILIQPHFSGINNVLFAFVERLLACA